MKRLTAVFLALMLLLTGCGCRPTNLMEAVPARTVCLAEQPEKQAEATDFALRLFQSSLEEGKNTLISPLSVLAALGMTENGAVGETLAQMKQTLGFSAAELNAYFYSYMDAQREHLKLANSIWFSDAGWLKVRQDFLETNADFYQADIFQTAFTPETCAVINDWVSEKTDGMIPAILEEIPANAVMYLINALAFEAQWPEAYREDQVWQSTFTQEDGMPQTAELMYSEESSYLEDENAAGFVKYYKGGDYAFAALLPKEGISVCDYVNTLTGAHLQELLGNAQEAVVNAAIPKFETQYAVEMKDILQSMGMTDAFDWEKADFTGICEDGGLFIGRVLHKTAITVAEQGTKAGAATAVEMNERGAMPQKDIKTVILDRPFVYMLIDCEQNLPFFLGTMMDVGGEPCGVPAAQPRDTEPAEPLSEPPAMEVAGEGQALLCQAGNYTWSQEQEDGTARQVVACGVHPLDAPEKLPQVETVDNTVELRWSTAPDSVTIRCWRDAETEAEGRYNGTLSLYPGQWVYEVSAVWPQGSASYAFRANVPEA